MSDPGDSKVKVWTAREELVTAIPFSGIRSSCNSDFVSIRTSSGGMTSNALAGKVSMADF